MKRNCMITVYTVIRLSISVVSHLYHHSYYYVPLNSVYVRLLSIVIDKFSRSYPIDNTLYASFIWPFINLSEF